MPRNPLDQIVGFLLDSQMLGTADFAQQWSKTPEKYRFCSESGCRYIESPSAASTLSLNKGGRFRVLLYKRKTIARADAEGREKGYQHPARGSLIPLLHFKDKKDAGMQLVVKASVYNSCAPRTSPTGIVVVEDYARAMKLREEARRPLVSERPVATAVAAPSASSERPPWEDPEFEDGDIVRGVGYGGYHVIYRPSAGLEYRSRRALPDYLEGPGHNIIRIPPVSEVD